MTTNETMPELKQACETFFDSWFGPAFGPPEHLERIAARHEKSKQEFSEKLYQFVQLWQKDDTVSAAVRDAIHLIEQSELDLSYYVHLATKAKTKNKWIDCEVYKIEMSIDRLRKALAALRGLGAE